MTRRNGVYLTGEEECEAVCVWGDGLSAFIDPCVRFYCFVLLVLMSRKLPFDLNVLGKIFSSQENTVYGKRRI